MRALPEIFQALAVQTSARLRNHDQHYQRLLRIAEHRSLSAEVRLECLMRAADFAQTHHTGRFADGALEQGALALGAGLPKAHVSDVSRGHTGGQTRRILHVATLVSPIGGHTRTIANWLRWDANSQHSLFLTSQGSAAEPVWLSEAVAESGGQINRSSAATPALSRAVQLRAWAQQGFDLVILHIHPQDLIPVVAFAQLDIPPVCLVNHADHVFWVGSSVTDALVNLRLIGAELSRERRYPRVNHLLPIPLTPPTSCSRAQARTSLGIPHEQLVLASVGRALKYRPTATHNFFSTAARILTALPSAHLYLVGVSTEEAEAFAGGQLPSNLHCTGPVSSASPYQIAADIYLEGFPFGSQTALLEAALVGTPTVPGYAPQLPLAMASDESLQGLVRVSETEEEYVEHVCGLARDRNAREYLGQMLAERITECHLGAGWLGRLATLYREAESLCHHVTHLPACQRWETQLDLALCEWLESLAEPQQATMSCESRLQQAFFEAAYRFRKQGDHHGASQLLCRSGSNWGWGRREVVEVAKLIPSWLLRRIRGGSRLQQADT